MMINMPEKPKRLCNKAGCNNLSNQSYCEIHRVEVEQRRQKLLAQRRGSSSSRGYDGAWRKVRARKLNINPFCERCESLKVITLATMVHHIKAINEGGKVLEWDNLQSLCEKCHDKIHSKQLT